MSRVKELESQLDSTERQLRLVQKISRLMVREGSLSKVLDKVVSLVVEFMHSDSCLIYLMQDRELVLCAAHDPQPKTIGQVRLKLGEGLTGWVAREKRFLAISREAYADPRFKLFKDLPEDTYEAFLSAPIVMRGRVMGVINVQHEETHTHGGGEMELLTTVGEQLGCLVALASVDRESLEKQDSLEAALAPARK